MIDQVAVDPDFDAVTETFDDHGIPLSQRLFGILGQVDDSSRLPLRDPPVLLRATSLLHIGHDDVLHNAPEVARVPVEHLNFNRFREHAVQRTRCGSVNQDTAIARLTREAIMNFQSIIRVLGVRDEVPVGSTEAHEHSVAHDERTWGIGMLIQVRDIDMPP